MSRYIDADKLIQDLNEFYANTDRRGQRVGDARLGINIAKQIVENQPTADVQEVKHGKWNYDDSDVGWASYECYDCGNIICTMGDEDDLYNFCPYCGAKMDKER